MPTPSARSSLQLEDWHLMREGEGELIATRTIPAPIPGGALWQRVCLEFDPESEDEPANLYFCVETPQGEAAPTGRLESEALLFYHTGDDVPSREEIAALPDSALFQLVWDKAGASIEAQWQEGSQLSRIIERQLEKMGLPQQMLDGATVRQSAPHEYHVQLPGAGLNLVGYLNTDVSTREHRELAEHLFELTDANSGALLCADFTFDPVDALKVLVNETTQRILPGMFEPAHWESALDASSASEAVIDANSEQVREFLDNSEWQVSQLSVTALENKTLLITTVGTFYDEEYDDELRGCGQLAVFEAGRGVYYEDVIADLDDFQAELSTRFRDVADRHGGLQQEKQAPARKSKDRGR